MSELPETFKPRPYQAAAIQALIDGWKNIHTRLAVVLPTGAGKTVVFSNLIRAHLATLAAAGDRALVIAHREELLLQAAAKIRAVCPDLKVGIVKAAQDEHQDVDVIVASIQTLAVERRRQAIGRIGLIIVDECHHAAADSYQEVLEHFGAWRGVPTAGFTATMTRSDGGLADVWQAVAYTLDILDMISDGYLCNVRGKRVTVDGLNLDDVKTRNGDLQEGQLGQALEDSGAAKVIAEAYLEHAADRPGVVFTPTVATAQTVADAFNAAGIRAAAVWGDMPREERAKTLADYKSGNLQVLTNCMVLTEGFDAPHTSCIVIARPTKSAGLYCQMVGRGLRLHEGKRDALVLDVMGASTRHKLASIVDLTGRDLAALKEDQSLLDAAEGAVREQEAKEKRAALAKLEFEDIDLFNNSRARWLRTDSGAWFIPLGNDMFLFLVRDEAGLYRVRRWDAGLGVRPPSPDPAWPLSEAMAWTEIHARRLAPALMSRSARWRSSDPSPKQLAFCRHQGIKVPRGSTAGDVSDLQAIRNVSAVLSRATAVPVAA